MGSKEQQPTNEQLEKIEEGSKQILQDCLNPFVSLEQKEIDYAKTLLHKAENDEKVARYCFETKDYDNAVFHLQQACEKSLKSMVLRFGLKNKEELRKEYRHNTAKLLLDVVRSIQGIKTVLAAFELTINEDELQTASVDIKNRRTMDLEDISTLIGYSEKIKSTDAITDVWGRVNDSVTNYFKDRRNMRLHPRITPPTQEELTSICKNMLRIAPVCWLAYATLPYAVDPRYENIGISENTPIVQKFEQIIGIQANIRENLNSLIDTIRPTAVPNYTYRLK